jgi:hypothetical protein
MTVTAFEPDRLVELSAAACGMEFTTRFTFTADGGKTRVGVAVRKRAVTLVAKLFTPLSFLMSGMMKKCIARDVAQVRAALEAAPAA